MALAVALAAGCSDDDSSTSAATDVSTTTNRPATTTTAAAPATTTTTTAAPSLEDAVRAYTAAFLGGDGEAAYALLSDRCQAETARNDFVDLVAQAHDLYGDETITYYHAFVDGNAAAATYQLTDPLLNQTDERWVLEGGAWHNDDC